MFLFLVVMPGQALNTGDEQNFSKKVTVKLGSPSDSKVAVQVTGGSLNVGAGTPGTTAGQNDVYVTGTLEVDGAVDLAASTLKLRGVTYTLPAADGTASYYLQTNGSGTLSWATATGTGNTLDQAYDQGGAGAGAVITVDSDALQLNGSHATNDTFFVNKTTGSGDSIQITNAGTGYDIHGTSGTWFVTKAGLVTGSAGTFSGAVSAGSFGVTGVTTIGNGTSSVAVNSSTWDVSTAGAFTGVASLDLTGDMTFATTKGIKSSTTTAQTVLFQGYDVDNTTYRPAMTITNGDTIAVAVGDGLETVAINSTTWDVSTAGAFTGVADITGTAGEALGITLASDGAADDLTISVTGATDSSVILASSGTGADAISLQASAGGIDVDAPAAQDVNIAGGQVAIVSKDDAASAISLTANIGVSETIVITNTQGTGESAITLTATAGGVNVDAAAAKDLDLAGGQVKLVSKDNAAGAISFTANIGSSETITTTNTQGTAEGAIALTATAGGVDIDAAAAKNIDISGGQVLVSSKDNAASAIALTANVGTSETIVVTNTQGTDAAAIALTATAGGITQTVAAGKAITLNGTVNIKVGSNIASPAGGELTLGEGQYFLITGTNNITSIAAASSTAGREVTLRFDNVLTFTDGGNLKIAGNFVTSADDTVTLICDGTNWYEKARSAN